jgi:hypothetical protein
MQVARAGKESGLAAVKGLLLQGWDDVTIASRQAAGPDRERTDKAYRS